MSAYLLKKVRFFILTNIFIVFFAVFSLPLKANSRLEQIKTMETEIQSLRKTLVDLESRLTTSDSKGTELANKLQTAIDERKIVVLASRARSAMLEIDRHAKQEYKRAYLLLANGKVSESQKAFEDFIQNNMGESHVVNAKYWLGEIKYYLGDYQQSNQDFIYVYRNSTNDYYRSYALYRVLEVFSELQKSEDVCKVATVLNDKYSDKFFSFEIENINAISQKHSCNITLANEEVKGIDKQNPFARDSKILPSSPSSLEDTLTEQDKEILQNTLESNQNQDSSGAVMEGNNPDREVNKAKPNTRDIQEIKTPDVSKDHVNKNIKGNSLYNMKGGESSTNTNTSTNSNTATPSEEFSPDSIINRNQASVE